MQRYLICVAVVLAAGCCSLACGDSDMVVFEDDFSALPRGPLFGVVGAHTEYHYLHEVAPKGNWAVSAFRFQSGSQLAWEVREVDGERIMFQTWKNRDTHNHPMLVAGDTLWDDYTVDTQFLPESDTGQSGVVFRYRNDRCYYFLGVKKSQVFLKRVRHATDFHKPDEKILAEQSFDWQPGQWIRTRIQVHGPHITAHVNDAIALQAEDTMFPRGKIAFMADVPAQYRGVSVTMNAARYRVLQQRINEREGMLTRLQQQNPKPVVWKKISTDRFGVGRNLRFGDLNNDGQLDVLIGQVMHYGPTDGYSELSCLTAMTFDGEQLWQSGTPDRWKNHLTNDVAFQIHDLDNDGRTEVVYTKNMELIVADGATGKTKYKAPTPASIAPADKFPRILGDCLFFCDLSGAGYPGDIIIKDRYWHIWVLNNRLELLWKAECVTGHYPYAADVDGDGRDELMMGYTLFDHDGTKLWSLDDTLKDHADGVAILNLNAPDPGNLRLLCAASDAGVFFADMQGNILKHHWIGHGQNPAIADFIPEMPGLETVSINFWGNQGILHFYTAEGDIYHDCEPNQYGSMCLPINWTGQPGEFFVHSPNVVEGGMFDGWGRPVVMFPDDGHPDMCNAVMDITGDCRDEVVVWDPYEIWVYTQDDNPKSGRLYKPQRNGLYNYSNYQATVSLPGWLE